jgi:hypothetical protein
LAQKIWFIESGALCLRYSEADDHPLNVLFARIDDDDIVITCPLADLEVAFALWGEARRDPAFDKKSIETAPRNFDRLKVGGRRRVIGRAEWREALRIVSGSGINPVAALNLAAFQVRVVGRWRSARTKPTMHFLAGDPDILAWLKSRGITGFDLLNDSRGQLELLLNLP